MDHEVSPKTDEKKVSTETSDTVGKTKTKINSNSAVPFIVGLFAGALTVFIVSLSVYSYGLYRNVWMDDLAMKVTRIVPLPMMSIDGDIVRYSTFLDDYASMEHFIAKQNELAGQIVRPTYDEVIKLLSDQYVKISLIESVAKEYDISVSEDDIDAEYEQLVGANESAEQVELSIRDLYNWDVDTYKRKVLRVSILERKVAEELAKDRSIAENEQAYSDIQEIRQMITDGGDFAQIASERTDDTFTASEGGSLGSFPRGVMIQEFEDAAFGMEPGSISDIITTSFGYHIIKLEDKTTGEDGVELATARHILKRTIDPNVYFNELRDAADITYYINVDTIPELQDEENDSN